MSTLMNTIRMLCTISTMLVMLSYTSLSYASDTQDGIRVSATGKTLVAPELVKLSLTFESTAKDVSKAKKMTSKQVNSLLSSLKSYAIEEGSVDSGNIHVAPRYSYHNGKQTLDGYQVTRTVQFALVDLSQLEALTTTITDNKVSRLNSLNFDVRDRTEAHANALKNAIQETKKAAEIIAQGYGVGLGSVKHIEHTIDQHSGPRPMAARAKFAESRASNEPNSYEIRDIEFQARVTAIFGIK